MMHLARTRALALPAFALAILVAPAGAAPQ
jgi:hypothetical protein